MVSYQCLDAASDIVNAFVRRLFPTPERSGCSSKLTVTRTLTHFLRNSASACTGCSACIRHIRWCFPCQGKTIFLQQNAPQTHHAVSQLLLPKYSHYFTHERRQEIRTLVQEAVDLLGAPEVYVDDKHGPKLFSRFLAGLLAAQSANPDILSPISKTMHLRRIGSRSKVTSGRGKEPSGSLSPASLNTYGSGLEFSSPSGFSESSSAQQFVPLGDNSHDQSPSTVDLGLGLSTPDYYQGAAMPVDQELLDSISFLSDPTWQDTAVPGEHFPLPPLP